MDRSVQYAVVAAMYMAWIQTTIDVNQANLRIVGRKVIEGTTFSIDKTTNLVTWQAGTFGHAKLDCFASPLD